MLVKQFSIIFTYLGHYRVKYFITYLFIYVSTTPCFLHELSITFTSLAFLLSGTNFKRCLMSINFKCYFYLDIAAIVFNSMLGTYISIYYSPLNPSASIVSSLSSAISSPIPSVKQFIGHMVLFPNLLTHFSSNPNTLK